MPSYSFLIAGCGSAGRSVAHVAAQDGRGQIAALVDPQNHQLEKLAALYPDATISPNYTSLLKETRPDVVVVAGPDHLHAEQTQLALEYNCHVLIEKPLATTIADARRIVEAAERSDRCVMTDHTMRYMHPWGPMAQAAQQGRIGEIFFIQGDYLLRCRRFEPHALARRSKQPPEYPAWRRLPPHRPDPVDHRQPSRRGLRLRK